MLHISDIKKFERCPRSFWLSRKERKSFVPFVNYNESMMELCKAFLMIGNDAYEGYVGDDGERALAAMHTHKILINARFVYEDMRVKIPILIQEEDKNIVYFTYKNCFPKETEAQGIADTLSVLNLIDIKVDEVYVIHLNHAYSRGCTLCVRDLLIVNDRLYNSKNKAQKTIVQLIEEHQRAVLPLIDALHACEQLVDIPAVRSSACTRGSKCLYFDDCFHESLQDTSILHLVQSAQKYEMLADGITDLKDTDVNRIEGTRLQYAQIMAAKHEGVYIDTGAMRCWIADHIHYPISYLDFEWETFAFPPYQGMKPYDVLTFQFSLHIEQEKGRALQHHGYIGTGDCREEFIQQLLKDVPKEGTILVYNMEGAEKLRLIQLAKQFPAYENALRQIWERMIDLSLPFSSGNYYDVRMAGGYSLKKLVPIFSNYSYQDLDISYGIDAVEKWRTYCDSQGADKVTLHRQLHAYCAMDTYAEYIVYHALEAFAYQP